MGKFFFISFKIMKILIISCFVKEMQTISSEHNHGGAVGRRGSWEYYERKNTTLDDSQMLNNKQDPKEYLT